MVSAPDIPGYQVGGVLGSGGFGAPPGLMAILRRGLAADPAARPPSAAALRDALAAPAVHAGIAAPTGMPAYTGVPAQTGRAVHPGRSAPFGRSAPAVSQPGPWASTPSMSPAPSAHPDSPALSAARQLPAGSWQIAVLPPDEAAFDGGARAYRCLAARSSGAESSTSQFGSQADQGGRDEHGGGGGRGRGGNG